MDAGSASSVGRFGRRAKDRRCLLVPNGFGRRHRQVWKVTLLEVWHCLESDRVSREQDDPRFQAVLIGRDLLSPGTRTA